MAIKKQIVIEIEIDGELNLKTHGFKGAECEEELKPIEKEVGKVLKRNRTKEYYETNLKNKSKIKSKTK